MSKYLKPGCMIYDLHLSISPENPLLQISIIILRKSTFHQEQDWESIEVRIDEIKLGILIWEFNL